MRMKENAANKKKIVHGDNRLRKKEQKEIKLQIMI